MLEKQRCQIKKKTIELPLFYAVFYGYHLIVIVSAYSSKSSEECPPRR